MGPKPIFIADGHHRYETACDYRDQVRDSGFLRQDHPANYVLMMCVAMEEPGLAVLPTHRLFRGLPPLDCDALGARLADCFVTQTAGEGPAAAADVWRQIEQAGSQETLGLYAQKDDRWLLAELTDAGRAKMADLAPDHGEAWRGLGVSLLHRLVVEHLLQATDLPRPEYVHLVDEVAQRLRTGEFPLAALVMPATVDSIRAVSLGGERMPAKSTYFYPKLLSGLVINPLE
jgi:uncharacterized protein (DUF1015 family)